MSYFQMGTIFQVKQSKQVETQAFYDKVREFFGRDF
jgi:hypothetical protein